MIKAPLRLCISVLALMYVSIAMMVFCLSLLLFWIAETTSTRMVCISIILFLPLPIVAYFNLFIRINRLVIKLFSLIFALSLLSLTIAITMTPRGVSPPNSSLQSIFLSDAGYQRFSLANIVPEIDQFKLGSYLISGIDPVIDKPQSKRIRELFLGVYRDLRRTEEYQALGSVMNYAYQDLFTNSRPSTHFFLYIPETVIGKKVPLMVFLHGSGGNFKGYMWKMRQFAEKNNVVVIAPSFGFGLWDRQGAIELIHKTLSYTDQHPRFSISNRYLIGLSNGGIGVYRLGTEFEKSFKGLVMISPVMKSSHASTSELAKAWDSRPVLVIHGSQDRRIPESYVKRECDLLEKGGVELQSVFIPHEDHFLMFSSWKEVSRNLEDWLYLVENKY